MLLEADEPITVGQQRQAFRIGILSAERSAILPGESRDPSVGQTSQTSRFIEQEARFEPHAFIADRDQMIVASDHEVGQLVQRGRVAGSEREASGVLKISNRAGGRVVWIEWYGDGLYRDRSE
jgi:hypothetical protein